jgi:hypothetical protein
MSQTSSDHSVPPVPAIPIVAGTPVITLTPEQSAAKLLEFRSSDGATLGYLFQDSGVLIYYTPEELATLQKRAEQRESGRTLREVLDSIQARAPG